jgi:hypothetical protein
MQHTPSVGCRMYVCRDNHSLNCCIDIYCSCREYTDELEDLKVAGWKIIRILLLVMIITRTHTNTHTHSTPPRKISQSRSKLCYDRRFSRPVCLGFKHPSGAYDQIFITVRRLRVCWCDVYNCCWPSPTQSFFGPRPAELVTILLSQIRDFPFRRLIRLAGNPPPHGSSLYLLM